MIFNGIEKYYVRVTRELFRPLAPPVEINKIEMKNGGSRYKNKRFTDYVLPVPVVIKSKTTIEDLKEDLSNWLVHDEPKKLEFKDQPGKYYLAVFESMELDEKIHYANGVINFYLPVADRFGKNNTIHVSDLTLHNIKGQKETSWKAKITFTEPASKYVLSGNYGRNITLNYDFIAGDVLEIDYRTRSITLNGNDLAVALSIKSNWFMLPVGNVYLEATHETELIYTERYY